VAATSDWGTVMVVRGGKLDPLTYKSRGGLLNYHCGGVTNWHRKKRVRLKRPEGGNIPGCVKTGESWAGHIA